MKYVFLAFFVFIASLPVQATSCDMQEPRGTTHSQHGDMQHDDMPEMDCCDQDPAAPPDSCDSNTHCGANANLAAITIYTTSVFHGVSKHRYFSEGDNLSSRFTSPPFRPPIIWNNNSPAACKVVAKLLFFVTQANLSVVMWRIWCSSSFLTKHFVLS